MTFLEREIRRHHAAAAQILLRGDALDYTAYASAVARYRVLDELLHDLDEYRKNPPEGDSDEDV